MVTQNYRVCGIRVILECHELQLREYLDHLWRQLFALQDDESILEDRGISLKLRPRAASPGPDPTGEQVFRSETLRILRTEAGYFFQGQEAQLELDLADNRAKGWLGEAFSALPVQDQREFFLLCFVILLRGHGLFGLHANGLLRDDHGILIVGESGAGKTTLTLGLMCQGWRLLSDDAIMLRRNGNSNEIEALALRRGFSCTQQTAEHFSRLIQSFDCLPSLRDSKRLIDTEALFPGSFSASCWPRTIIFPVIAHQYRSQLVPMEESEAIFSLISQSPGIMTEQPWAAQQLELLQRLILQADSYRLISGTDVFEEPESVSRLIRDTLKEASWAK